MKELLNKIAKAKKQIHDMDIKKEGRNSFSKYDYFTPSQIEGLVNKACEDNEIITTFDLIRSECCINYCKDFAS